MFIDIRAVDEREPIATGTQTVNAWWIDFASGFGAGRALFVPSQCIKPLHSGSTPWTVSVETGQEAVRNVERISAEPSPACTWTPLSEPGCFRVCGWISAICDSGGASPGDSIIDVYVGTPGASWRFTLANGDVAGMRIEPGDWLRFEIVGLSLWDEGL